MNMAKINNLQNTNISSKNKLSNKKSSSKFKSVIENFENKVDKSKTKSTDNNLEDKKEKDKKLLEEDNNSLEKKSRISNIKYLDDIFLMKINASLEDRDINIANKDLTLEDDMNLLELEEKNTLNLDKNIENISKNVLTDMVNNEKKDTINIEDNIKNSEKLYETEFNPLVKSFKEKIQFNELVNRVNTFNERDIYDKNDLDLELREKNISGILNKNIMEKDLDFDLNKEEDNLESEYEFKNLNQVNIIRNTDIKFENKIEKLSLVNVKNIEQEIIQEVKTISNAEIKEVKVQLYPKDLGSLDIELALEDGHLKAKITVSNENVKQLFTNSMEDLNKNLLKQNISLKEVFVDVESGFNDNSKDSNSKKRKNLKRDFDDGLEKINISNIDISNMNTLRLIENISVLA